MFPKVDQISSSNFFLVISRNYLADYLFSTPYICNTYLMSASDNAT